MASKACLILTMIKGIFSTPVSQQNNMFASTNFNNDQMIHDDPVRWNFASLRAFVARLREGLRCEIPHSSGKV